VTGIGYAFALGLVAALNPCGFPLLPAYLASFVEGGRGIAGGRGIEGGRGVDAGSIAGRVMRGLRAGLALTVGFVLVFVTIGIPLAAGVRLLIGWAPWLMIAVGAAMIASGILMLRGRSLRLPFPGLAAAGSRSALPMVGYGVAYAVGSLSCSLPLFVAGVASTFVTGSVATGLLSVLVYAFGMGVFVTGAAVVVSLAGGALLRRAGRSLRIVPIIASIVIVAVGVYLVAFWTASLADPAAATSISAGSDLVSAGIGGWIGANPILTGGILVLIVAAGLSAVALSQYRTEGARRGN
jgi:cytochrome c-type biogenesis protein